MVNSFTIIMVNCISISIYDFFALPPYWVSLSTTFYFIEVLILFSFNLFYEV